ncbi:MAG: phosphatase PAP2 family protein [Gemmatimonadales bacterium]
MRTNRHGWTRWLRQFARDWLVVVLLGAVALSGFARVGEDVLENESKPFDGAVQGWILAHQQRGLDTIFRWITAVGGITGMCVLALLAAAYLWYRGQRRVASGVLVAPAVAIVIFQIVKRIYARPRPLGLGSGVDSSYSFPSGHATASAAVCCTVAYVFWREGFVRRPTAIAFAVIVPLLVGMSRLYLNVHWATDVLGGWCAGVAIAALAAALYDRHRRRRALSRSGTATRATALVVAFTVAIAPASKCQGVARPSRSEPLITGRDLGLVAGATIGAAAISLLDVPIARTIGDSAFHLRHPGFGAASRRGSLPTETVLMITGGLVYGIARIRKDDGTADVALHTTESVASAAMFIQVVRGALGRARPYVIDDSGGRHDGNPYDFQPLHGFTSFNYRSFPSMHAMASFAVASALAQEMRQRDSPHRHVIDAALYAGAAVPSLARMYLDEHWASDIAMGAFLGIFSGQKVVMYSHDHPDNPIDRRLLHPRVSATVTLDARGLSFGLLPF